MQRDVVNCGFYVARFMRRIIERRWDATHISKKVSKTYWTNSLISIMLKTLLIKC
jgi:hypothetical protein